MRTLAILAAFVAPLACQATVLLPNPQPLVANTNLPFSAGIGRYQQWFAPGQTIQLATTPVRIDQIQVIGGTASATTTTLDLQVAMAHAAPTGITSVFDQNYVTPAVTVLPRSIVTLVGSGAGSNVLTLPLTTPFTWDGTSAFLVEIRVFGNGLGNAPFNFDLRGTAQGLGAITRVYQGGNANANSGAIATGQGLFLRFRTRPGAQVPFGIGCRGFNLITPTCTTDTLPQPGITWTHRLNNASAQHFAALVIGTSRTQWVTPSGTIPLPLDFGPINGGTFCSLLTNPEIVELAVTIGSQGTGQASVGIAIPPLTTFVGLSVFSQWVVEDPAALNNVMSATAGLWSIVAPVGG